MNIRTILMLAVSWIVVFSPFEPAVAGTCGGCCGAAVQKSSPALTEAEARDLKFMLEEEKLARDVYNAMYELYDQRVFITIPRAEQRHMEAIQGLINNAAEVEPVLKAGKFRNQTLQKLYDDLVARGSTSRLEAYRVGALIEEIDIKDLEDALKRTDNEAIQSVYRMLLSGSGRHLNAFVRNYEAVSGKTYQAQKMTQEEVNEILGR